MLLALLFSVTLAFAADSPVLASVEGETVTEEEFLAAIAKKKPADGKAFTEAERLAVVDALLVDKVLLAKAKKEKLEDDPRVQRAMIDALLQRDAYTNIPATFNETVAKAYYDAHQNEFMAPPKVQVYRILVTAKKRTDAEAKAAALTLRGQVAKDPKGTFATVAKANSEGAEKARGGLLGTFSRMDATVDAAVLKRAFLMKAGEVSVVFKTTEGYTILYVPQRVAAAPIPYAQVKDRVQRSIRVQKLAAAKTAYHKKVVEELPPKVNEARLRGVDIPMPDEVEDATKADAEDSP